LAELERLEAAGQTERDAPEETADGDLFDLANPIDGRNEPLDGCADDSEDDEEERKPVTTVLFLDLVREERAEARADLVGA
jgi:hypothetical protein